MTDLPNNDDKILKLLKEQYEKPMMSDKDICKMKQRMEKGKEEKRLLSKKRSYMRLAIAAAAVLAILILPNISSAVAHAMENIPVLGGFFKVITFRDYHYEDERNIADVVIPEISTEGSTDNSSTDAGKKTADEINAEIREIANKWIEEFKSNMENEGYHNIMIDSEVIATTEDYFTLKLICFWAAGSGYEENHFYTIDLNTGKKVELADLFKEGSDYRRIISENIKKQMREQMAADDSIKYWIDNEEYPEWNFNEITDETSFYINGNGEIVICFNEGEVAPAYVGTVEFTIPKDVVADILK
ncbi:RsiV family protein [Acetivibrio clariflavus]|uniref:RsiV family protein n=1 Tax=Acetivibrio clariflavus TaxID=288965 RepID=UPI000684BF15